jgi:hypothetical protein
MFSNQPVVESVHKSLLQHFGVGGGHLLNPYCSLINPLLNLCIRVSCNRMGLKNREGKATTTTAREKTRFKIREKETCQ